MITKYKATNWGHLIETVQVERETGTSVWIRGQRTAKRSAYSGHFDTFCEAKAFLVKCAEERLSSAKRALENAHRHAEKINGLKET